jgi:hypothetical protein
LATDGSETGIDSLPFALNAVKQSYTELRGEEQPRECTTLKWLIAANVCTVLGVIQILGLTIGPADSADEDEVTARRAGQSVASHMAGKNFVWYRPS